MAGEPSLKQARERLGDVGVRQLVLEVIDRGAADAFGGEASVADDGVDVDLISGEFAGGKKKNFKLEIMAKR